VQPSERARHLGDLSDVSGVQIVEWPRERERLELLESRNTPRLVLVEEGTDPPTGADCRQDWMWASGDQRELRMRVHQLTLRSLGHGESRPQLDALGLLHVGMRSIPLPAKERALAAVLIEHFNDVVPAEDLVRAAWPAGVKRPNVLASRISMLRSRLDWVGLEILGRSSKGYVLRPQSVVLEEHLTGFE
jgi:DNA-binding response OmpR family regulator